MKNIKFPNNFVSKESHFCKNKDNFLELVKKCDCIDDTTEDKY